MKRSKFVLGALLIGAVAALVTLGLISPDGVPVLAAKRPFVENRLPSATTYELMDIGVADVNGDDLLDIFTANHNSRQMLWVANADGGYRDMLSAWGLDQDPKFPGMEISESEPQVDEPGVYIYWKGRNARSKFSLVIRTHRLAEVRPLNGSLRTYSGILRYDGPRFTVQDPTSVRAADHIMPETTMGFATERDGVLEVEIASPGAPINIRLHDAFPLRRVFVGRQKISPRSTDIDLAFQDRHGMAWLDYNGDGWLDVFISRGAIGGTLRMFPESIQKRVRDELLLSQAGGHYRNVSADVGLEKYVCSGRKAAWVDFDNDGLMDLFINCQERGYVAGKYPKQLHRHKPDGKFVDVAADVGLDVPGHEIIDFVWLDADGDGYADLVTHEEEGFFLYRNHGGKSFSREFIGRGKFVRGDNPQLRGTSDEYWFVDGKLLAADFDGDGNLDVFCASKRGNVLLINNGKGQFSVVDPAAKGLPGESATAAWVDFDNDGLVDLHAVPQGLFRQRRDHTFESTGLLELPSRKYMAAIVNWADFDNDGRRDVLMALLENFSFWTWWERLYKTSADRFKWQLISYRNVGAANHWLQARLVGKAGNPQAIGAQVTVQTAEGRQTQVVGLNDGAFFSQGHYRVYFGLGPRARAEVVRIRWPDGQVQELRDVEGDRLHVIRQGEPERREAAK